MAKSSRLKPTTSLRFVTTCLKILGVWHFDGPFQTLYYIYGKIIYVAVSILYSASMIMHQIQVWGDIPEMIDGLCLMITITCIIFKCGFLDNNKMKNVVTKLDSEELNSQTTDQEFFVERAMHIAHRNSFAFCLLCTSISWSLNLAPIFTGAFQLKQLPFKAWFPFPYTVSPYYEVAYLYQFFGIWFGAIMNCSLDGLVGGLLAIACSQLQVLKHSLQNLRERALAQLDRLKGKQDLCEKCNNGPMQWRCNDPSHLSKGGVDLDEETYREMVNCVRHHQAIIEFVSEIESTFTMSMFAQFSSSMMVTCITAFELSVRKPFTVLFFTIFFYMVNMILQLFFYCWYGNELYLMSLTINEDIYNSDWYRFGPRITHLMLIMMERAKKPLKITAGQMFPLSLETFTSIMKSAYSFYAVLNQMEIDINLDG